MRSYTSCAGRHRPSGSQHVTCGVHVPVLGRAAPARPGTNVQWHLDLHRAAGGAQPGGGEEPVHRDHFPPVPGGLVLQHAAELGPCRVADGAGEFVVSDHVAHGQVLDHDRLIFTNESGGQLVQTVTAPVGDPGVDHRDLPAGLAPVAPVVLGLAGQLALSLRQTGPVTALLPGIGDLLTSGEGQQVVHTHVTTDRRSGGRERLHVRVVAQYRNGSAPGAVLRDRHRGRLRPLGERPRPHDAEWAGHLGQGQPAVPEAESTGGVLGGLPRRGAGGLGALCEEASERGLQAPQRLLQRRRRHVVEGRRLLGLLSRGHQHRGLVLVDPLVPRPRLGTGGEHAVRDLSHTSERSRQASCLRTARTEAVHERPLHLPRGHAEKPARPHVVTKPAGHGTAIRPGGESHPPAQPRRSPLPLRSEGRSIDGGTQ